MDVGTPDDAALAAQSRSGPIDPPPEAATSATASLKRSAAEAFDGDTDSADEETSRKKAREGDGGVVPGGGGENGEEDETDAVDGAALADRLEEELECGCCSAIVYRPVVVAPCQHFFCGRCVGCGLLLLRAGANVGLNGVGARCSVRVCAVVV